MTVRKPMTYDRDADSDRFGISFDGPSMTQQQFKTECDINTIVRRFHLDGRMPTSVRVPTYGDFTGISDYQSALEALRQADADFMALPASLRSEFDNDPQQLLQFVSDESNRPQAIKLGLIPDPEAQVLSPPIPSEAPKAS